MNSLKITYLDKILHEMNGSINNIYFLSNFMLNKAKLDKGDDKEGLRNIYEATKKLIKMVSLLSTIANLKSDKINIQLN